MCYDPGHFAPKRSYRFLPYQRRQFQRWQHSIGPTVAACIIMGTLVLLGTIALTLNALLPSPFVIDEATARCIQVSALSLTIVCTVVAIGYAAVHVMRRMI